VLTIRYSSSGPSRDVVMDIVGLASALTLGLCRWHESKERSYHKLGRRVGPEYWFLFSCRRFMQFALPKRTPRFHLSIDLRYA
jgi:hypothetical protein